ncbi:MAG: YraN family protein [Oscillospiraceae bacterium]|nr:YraN family protein [Oscillospiraceae bacterium]
MEPERRFAVTRRGAFGQYAEDQAVAFLEAKGYKILARNYRVRAGEIDIVALSGYRVVFVEVKARSDIAHGYPREAVTPLKQARVARAACAFLEERDLSDAPSRFDVIEVYGGRIVHWRNAFEAVDI